MKRHACKIFFLPGVPIQKSFTEGDDESRKYAAFVIKGSLRDSF